MLSGECLCGAVRYEIDGRISKIWLCHCSKCRRTTGGPLSAAALCRTAQFRWVRGEEALTEYRSASGYRTRFCKHCGSPAPSPTANGEAMVITPGTLAGDPGSRVAYHIFVGSKAPWDEISDALPQHAEHAPVPS